LSKHNSKHLGTFRKFLVTHGVIPSESDIPVFITFLGSLVVYIIHVLIAMAAAQIKRAVRRTYIFIRRSLRAHGSHSFSAAITSAFKKLVTNIYFRLFVFFDNRREYRKVFRKRTRDFGLAKALSFAVSDGFDSLKNNAYKLKTAANIALPTAAVVVLVMTGISISGAGFGVSVIADGETIGVVSAEDVYVNAARSFREQASYYDVENSTGEAFVTARLEITPQAADVMDAASLAEALKQTVGMTEPVQAFSQSAPIMPITPAPVVEPVQAPTETEAPEGKIKAYGVTVDGEFLGAIDEPRKIDQFLEKIKAAGYDPDAIDISFDRDIDYDYEQFYYPTQLIDEKRILDTLSGTRQKAVYIEVENGDNPWDLARENGVSLDELLACPAEYDGEPIENIEKFLPVGARIQLSADVPYLNLLVTKPKTYELPVDFTVLQTYDDSMYRGETKVVTKGMEGLDRIEANVTYSDGQVVSRKILSRTTISDPVPQVELVGTKEPKTMVATGGGSGSYFWPVAGGKISAYMGDGRGHKGLDISAPYGTNIYAAAQGTVTRAGNKGDGYGICVFITNADGNVTVYGHMSSLADIAVGDTVVAGQLIGYVGSTGNSTGNHLHFEVRSNGAYKNPLDYVSQY
jgi:hypothetical protein